MSLKIFFLSGFQHLNRICFSLLLLLGGIISKVYSCWCSLSFLDICHQSWKYSSLYFFKCFSYPILCSLSWDSNHACDISYDIILQLWDAVLDFSLFFSLFSNVSNFYWPIFKFTDYFLDYVKSTDGKVSLHLCYCGSNALQFPFDSISAEIAWLLLYIYFPLESLTY